MARKLIVCIGIFVSLFAGFFILDHREERGMARQGIQPGVRIQQSELDEVETAKTYIPFKPREYVRIIPQ